MTFIRDIRTASGHDPESNVRPPHQFGDMIADNFLEMAVIDTRPLRWPQSGKPPVLTTDIDKRAHTIQPNGESWEWQPGAPGDWVQIAKPRMLAMDVIGVTPGLWQADAATESTDVLVPAVWEVDDLAAATPRFRIPNPTSGDVTAKVTLSISGRIGARENMSVGMSAGVSNGDPYNLLAYMNMEDRAASFNQLGMGNTNSLYYTIPPGGQDFYVRLGFAWRNVSGTGVEDAANQVLDPTARIDYVAGVTT